MNIRGLIEVTVSLAGGNDPWNLATALTSKSSICHLHHCGALETIADGGRPEAVYIAIRLKHREARLSAADPSFDVTIDLLRPFTSLIGMLGYLVDTVHIKRKSNLTSSS